MLSVAPVCGRFPGLLFIQVKGASFPRMFLERNSHQFACSWTGWGRTGGGQPAADILQQAVLPAVSDAECRKKYGGMIDRKAHLCAGEGRSAASGGCNGDSGGPLVCEENGKFVLHGAVSFGRRNCPTTHFTVFARINSYLDWISNKIGGGQ